MSIPTTGEFLVRRRGRIARCLLGITRPCSRKAMILPLWILCISLLPLPLSSRSPSIRLLNRAFSFILCHDRPTWSIPTLTSDVDSECSSCPVRLRSIGSSWKKRLFPAAPTEISREYRGGEGSLPPLCSNITACSDQ